MAEGYGYTYAYMYDPRGPVSILYLDKAFYR